MSGAFLLSAETTFSAAHTLPGVDRCARMHGHNWRVRVTVRVDAARLDATGIGVDFRVLEQMTQAAVADFEHRYLNELDAFSEQPPTAETIARIVAGRIASRLDAHPSGARVAEVELWELPHYRAVYHP